MKICLAGLPARLRVGWPMGLILLVGIPFFMYVVTGLYHLDWTRLNFISADHPLALLFFKTLLSYGTFHENAQLAFPSAAANFYSFPVPDGLPYLLISFLGLFSHDTLFVYHLYMLVAVSMNAIAAALVGRWLGLSHFLAVILGLGFGTCYFVLIQLHLHPFLSLLPCVPLVCGLALYLSYLRPGVGEDSSRMGHASVLAALIGVGLGLSNIYCIFFGLIVMGVGTIMAFYRLGPAHKKNLLKPVAVFLASTIVVFLITYAPIALQASHDTPTRHFHEQLMYGIRLSNLFLMNVPPFDEFYDKFVNSQMPSTEGWNDGFLGIWGAVGLLASLMFIPFGLSRARQKGMTMAATWRRPMLQVAAVIIVGCLLFGMVHGFGHLFNAIITPVFRTQIRIIVFIFFLCWLVAFLFMARRMRKAKPPIKLALGMVVLMGFVAGLLPSLGLSAKVAQDYHRFSHLDNASLKAVLNVLDQNNLQRVAQLPLMPFPESPPMEKMDSYHQAKLYVLDSNPIRRYSFGLMQHQQEWKNLQAVNNFDPAQQAQGLACMGFDAIVLERLGYAQGGQAWLSAAAQVKQRAAIRHNDRLRVVLDLRDLPVNASECAKVGQIKLGQIKIGAD